MKSFGRIAGMILAWIILLVIVAALAYTLWLIVPGLLVEVTTLYREADPEFRLGLITAVFSTAGVVWSVIYQRKKELDSLRFERKREAYGVFFDLLFDFMKAGDTEIDIMDPALQGRFQDLQKKMMIWGSPGTINAFNRFQVESLEPAADIKVTFARMETLLRQFRSDLGHQDRKLKKFALTKLILKSDEHHQLDK